MALRVTICSINNVVMKLVHRGASTVNVKQCSLKTVVEASLSLKIRVNGIFDDCCCYAALKEQKRKAVAISISVLGVMVSAHSFK